MIEIFHRDGLTHAIRTIEVEGYCGETTFWLLATSFCGQKLRHKTHPEGFLSGTPSCVDCRKQGYRLTAWERLNEAQL